MFTVKLYKGHSIKLIQAEQIDVYAVGPATGIADDPKERTNDVREVSCHCGEKPNQVFYITVAKEPKAGWPFPAFDMAYIENENGATTEVVRPY
jgi:hypothetical protein